MYLLHIIIAHTVLAIVYIVNILYVYIFHIILSKVS